MNDEDSRRMKEKPSLQARKTAYTKEKVLQHRLTVKTVVKALD